MYIYMSDVCQYVPVPPHVSWGEMLHFKHPDSKG